MPPINGRATKRRADLDQVFRALADTMRRRILTALMTDNPRQPAEFTTAEFRPAEADRERLELELHHAHLPLLDEAGFIEWDSTSDEISRGEDFEQIRPLLELMDEHREELPDDWP